MNATSPVGALLLCRTEPDSVRPVAHLLRERMLLAPAGDGWSVLVPEGKPWQDAGEGDQPVDSVVGGWATALAVGSTWPVLALWWDGDRAWPHARVRLPAARRIRLAGGRDSGG